MKTILRKFVAMTLVAVLAFGFVACSSDSDKTIRVYTYEASGSLSGNGNDASAAFTGLVDYTKAIETVIGGSYTFSEMDNEVVSACDAVFKKHLAEHPSLRGTIEIRKTVGTTSSSDETLPATILKTYKYE